MKWLGDGVMLHFPNPGNGVMSALEMVAGVADAGLPPAHVGLHAGPVIFQEGDYYGQTVNLASRIADYAQAGEVIVSQEVVDASNGRAGRLPRCRPRGAQGGARSPAPVRRGPGMSEPPMMSLGPLNETAIEPMREAIRTIGGKDVSIDDLRRRVAASGEWGDHGIEFGVSRGDVLLGVVQAMACPFRDTRDTYEVGILIFDPEQRGHGLGFEALSLLLAYLFDERSAIRVWFTTDEDNVAMRRLGEHLGFRLEGMLRGGHEVEGRLIDEVLYGMTRDDPRAQVRSVD